MYQLHVEGMSCNHCISTVTKSILGVDDAAKVQVDLSHNIVHVDSKIELEVIKDAVTEAGYPVIDANIT